jgi:hypothetical protein
MFNMGSSRKGDSAGRYDVRLKTPEFVESVSEETPESEEEVEPATPTPSRRIKKQASHTSASTAAAA